MGWVVAINTGMTHRRAHTHTQTHSYLVGFIDLLLETGESHGACLEPCWSCWCPTENVTGAAAAVAAAKDWHPPANLHDKEIINDQPKTV